ncbi:hypothetical protein C0995_013607 [Termitomyces sp. Mi166|nr:hypothetical protein C0995_013607 [Termitomyces sp. Mi166\
MDFSPTNPALEFLSSQNSLMMELFGDKKNETSEIPPESSEPVTELSSNIDYGPYAASTQWQPTSKLHASTFPTPFAPSPNLAHYATQLTSHTLFYGVQAPDISFEAMRNLILPPQLATTYQEPSCSCPQIQDYPDQFFYPTQFSTAVDHYQPLSYQDTMPSSIPSPMTTLLHFHPRDHYDNGLPLDPPPFSPMPPANFAQYPGTHENTTSRFISPTPSNGTTNSSATQSSSTSTSRTPRRIRGRPHHIPRISRTELSLARGVFCDFVFECQWGSCRTAYLLEGTTNVEEAAFQNRVFKHLSEHAQTMPMGRLSSQDVAED